MLAKCIEECEQSIMFFDELLKELVNEEAIELKLRRFYEYSASFALANETPVIEVPHPNFFLIQSPSFTFMNSNSSKQTPYLGNMTPNFNAEATNLTFPGQTSSKPGVITEDLPPNQSGRNSSTNPMRRSYWRENIDSNRARINESSETIGNKVRIDDGWTLEKLAQSFDEDENIPKISNKKKYNQLMESARKSLPFKVDIPETNYDHMGNIERTISDIPVKNDNISEEFEDGEAYFGESDSDDNYEITDHSSNESSNNLSHEIQYRDENGNIVSHGQNINMSKFIDDHRGPAKSIEKEDNFNGNFLSMLSGNKTPTQYFVLDHHNMSNQNLTPGVRMFCNNKRIPRWAENKDRVTKKLFKQKQSTLHLNTFGVMRPITNLNLECIMGAEPKSPLNRSESILWLTPESMDRRGQKANVSKVMQNMNMNIL